MDHEEQSGGSWLEWKQHVLLELVELNNGMKERDKTMQKMQVQIAILQVKAGVWGLAGGALALLVAWMIQKF